MGHRADAGGKGDVTIEPVDAVESYGGSATAAANNSDAGWAGCNGEEGTGEKRCTLNRFRNGGWVTVRYDDAGSSA